MGGEGRKRKAEEEKNKVEQEAKRHQAEKKDESEKKDEREKKEESEDEGSYVSCSTCSSDNNWEEGQEEDSSNDGLPGFGKEL